VAVDLPGHGARGGSLKGLRINDCVDTVISEFPKDGRIVLVGHSMGGAIALAVASRAPARIAHVVLIAGMVPQSGAPLVSSFPPLMRLISKAMLRLTPEFAQPVGTIKAKLLNGMTSSQADEAAAKFGKESSSLFLDEVQWRRVPQIPVTYVRCLNDRGGLSPAFQEQLAHRLGSDVEIASIAACHYAMLEKPADVAALLDSIAAK